MPRYFLHVCNGLGFVQDHEGTEHPNLAAVRDAAIAGLRDISASELEDGVINLASFIEVEDEHRQHVLTVSFTDAVAIATEVSCSPG